MPGPRSPREYGLGSPDAFIRGVPQLVGGPMPMACPICGGETLFALLVNVENPLLLGSKGIGSYVGCAACPYASPMVMRALETRKPGPSSD